MAKSYPINPSTPADTEEPRLGASRIRGHKNGVIELANVDHYVGVTNDDGAYDENDAGKHKQVTFRNPVTGTPNTSDPTLGTNDVGVLFIKQTTDEDSESVSDLYFKTADGVVIRLTYSGVFSPGNVLKLIGTSPTIFFTDTDLTSPEGKFKLVHSGNNIILYEKTDDSPETWQAIVTFARDSNITFGDTDVDDGEGGYEKRQLKNIADPTANQDAATKAYVDALLAAIAYNPTSMTSGTNSVTLGNGLIIKWAAATSTQDSTESFTFAVAFPTGCYAVFTQSRSTATPSYPPGTVASVSKTGFTLDRNGNINGNNPFWYFAIGY